MGLFLALHVHQRGSTLASTSSTGPSALHWNFRVRLPKVDALCTGVVLPEGARTEEEGRNRPDGLQQRCQEPLVASLLPVAMPIAPSCVLVPRSDGLQLNGNDTQGELVGVIRSAKYGIYQARKEDAWQPGARRGRP